MKSDYDGVIEECDRCWKKYPITEPHNISMTLNKEYIKDTDFVDHTHINLCPKCSEPLWAFMHSRTMKSNLRFNDPFTALSLWLDKWEDIPWVSKISDILFNIGNFIYTQTQLKHPFKPFKFPKSK